VAAVHSPSAVINLLSFMDLVSERVQLPWLVRTKCALNLRISDVNRQIAYSGDGNRRFRYIVAGLARSDVLSVVIIQPVMIAGDAQLLERNSFCAEEATLSARKACPTYHAGSVRDRADRDLF